MMVVSNTSPMTSLAAISQLDLLRNLYGTVIIPQAVYDELKDYGCPSEYIPLPARLSLPCRANSSQTAAEN